MSARQDAVVTERITRALGKWPSDEAKLDFADVAYLAAEKRERFWMDRGPLAMMVKRGLARQIGHHVGLETKHMLTAAGIDQRAQLQGEPA